MAASSNSDTSNNETKIYNLNEVFIGAVKRGKVTLVKTLLKNKKPDLNVTVTRELTNPQLLQNVLNRSNFEIEQNLLAFAIEMFYKELPGKRKENRFMVIELLLEYGANPNILLHDVSMAVPVSLARNERRLIRPHLLHDVLNQIAFSSRSDKTLDRTPRYIKSMRLIDAQKVFFALINRTKTNIDIQSEELLQTPLHLAVVLENTEVLKFLLEDGANYTLTDSNGRTPLSMAVQQGWEEGVQQLLSYGAPATDELATIATNAGHEKIAAWLTKAMNTPLSLQAQAIAKFSKKNLDNVGTEKETARQLRSTAASRRNTALGIQEQIRSILQACKRGDATAVRSAIDSNPSLKSVRTGTGKSLAQYAQSLGHDHIVAILKKK